MSDTDRDSSAQFGEPPRSDAARKPDERAKRPSPRDASGAGKLEHEHRLRTTTFDEDFEDAESDSSAATIHRDDECSDS